MFQLICEILLMTDLKSFEVTFNGVRVAYF